MKSIAIALTLFLTATAAFAHQVIGISDGDTLTLLVDRKPLKILLASIDAPEKTQAFGDRSKQSLSDLISGRTRHTKRRRSISTVVPWLG
jgi:micrococcal nuclease